jgi:hypothetical protein
MGIKSEYLEYVLECIGTAVGDLSGKKMLELGDQMLLKEELKEKTGKEYFENRGVLHTSVDLNGCHGAIKIDLAKPIERPDWKNYFDIVTNFGTIEHIEPKKAQYECFKNVHNCLKVGGIAVHFLPDIDELIKNGSWKKHCNNYYSHNFVNILVNNNDYELLSLKVINGLISPCYRKKSDSLFMQDRNEFLRHIVRKKGGDVYIGINESTTHRMRRLSFQIPYRIARKIYNIFGTKALKKREKV